MGALPRQKSIRVRPYRSLREATGVSILPSAFRISAATSDARALRASRRSRELAQPIRQA